MIIYGSKAVHLKSAQSKTATCPSCKTQGSLVFSVFRKHAHVFWIPLFPIGKKGASQCQHCKNVTEAKDMPESLKREYANLKEDVKGPIWQFSGLALIALLFVWGSYSSGVDKENELEYLAVPMVGDIYHYKPEMGSYSTMKVVNVSTDSVFVSPNEYEINKMTRIYKIDKPENYAEFSFGLSKDKVREMYDSGDIYNIKRK